MTNNIIPEAPLVKGRHIIGIRSFNFFAGCRTWMMSVSIEAFGVMFLMSTDADQDVTNLRIPVVINSMRMMSLVARNP